MSGLFTYYQGDMSSFLDDAISVSDDLLKIIVADVAEDLLKDLSVRGIKLDSSYCHVLDHNAVKHALKQHGMNSEKMRGQLPVTKSDFLLLPDILSDFESISLSINKRNQHVLLYHKTIAETEYICAEEVRLGRRELAVCTLYKKKKG